MMKKKENAVFIIFLAALVLALTCCNRERGTVSSGAQIRSPQLSSLTEEEKAAGWVLLFDGRSFKGWRGIGQPIIPPAHWVIEEGAIKKVPGGEVPRQADGQPVQGGDLMTEGTYEDFELRLEWKISPGGNSGIKYNVSEEISMANPPPQAAIGFEYQILDDETHPDAANGPTRKTAALYDLMAPEQASLRPVGEYNETRIVFQGSHGEHWLNGIKVLEFDIADPQFAERVAASKFRDIPGFAEKRSGHIVLQDHGDAVWFRNIKIKLL